MNTMKGISMGRLGKVLGLGVALVLGLLGPVGLGVKGPALAQGQNVEWVGQIRGATWAVAVSGRYAYVGVGPRLVVLDVGDPSWPQEVGRTGVLPGVVEGVAVSGTHAYVADGDGGLVILQFVGRR